MLRFDANRQHSNPGLELLCRLLPESLCVVQHSEGQSVLSLYVIVHCSLGVWTPCVSSSSKNPQLPQIHLSSGLAQQPLVSWGRLWGLEVCPSMSHARKQGLGWRLPAGVLDLSSCTAVPPAPVMVPPDFGLWELWAENQESGER